VVDDGKGESTKADPWLKKGNEKLFVAEEEMIPAIHVGVVPPESTPTEEGSQQKRRKKGH